MNKDSIFMRMRDISIMGMPGGTGIKRHNHLHTLNSTAYEIFELCDGNRTVRDIENVMVSRYRENSAEECVEAFMEKLLSLGLVREKNGHDFVRFIR
jgi:hypothetical protein